MTHRDPRSRRCRPRLADYVELTKPRIAVLVLVHRRAGRVRRAVGAGSSRWSCCTLSSARLLVAASAQRLQSMARTSTATRCMPRTADRPLPAGRLSAAEVRRLRRRHAASPASPSWLLLVNALAALLGARHWIAVRRCVYTPLKTRTPLNTVVGAVAGALPVLIGWAAAVAARLRTAAARAVHDRVPLAVSALHGDRLDLSRRIRAAPACRCSPVVDPSGRRAGLHAPCSPRSCWCR